MSGSHSHVSLSNHRGPDNVNRVCTPRRWAGRARKCPQEIPKAPQWRAWGSRLVQVLRDVSVVLLVFKATLMPTRAGVALCEGPH